MTSYTEAGDGNVFTICILSRLIRRRLIMVLRFIYIRLFNVRILQQSFGILWKPRLSSSDDTKVSNVWPIRPFGQVIAWFFYSKPLTYNMLISILLRCPCQRLNLKVTLKSTSPCVRNVSCCPDKYVLSGEFVLVFQVFDAWLQSEHGSQTVFSTARSVNSRFDRSTCLLRRAARVSIQGCESASLLPSSSCEIGTFGLRILWS